ncbi:MAG TPA: carbohydrate ABC transporter permease [Nitriliruptoraceae bacterium]|nr:carbohydrate ABC transporter permease [Nitriliruptoraceae bacterium]
MSATTPTTTEAETPTKLKPSKEGGVSNPATLWVIRIIVLAIVLIWLVPAIGLLITSLRDQAAITSSGWWTVFTSIGDFSQWTLDNYNQVLTSQGFDSAFINTMVVAVPATIMPITIATFAAYAFSWMEFRGRTAMFITIIGLMAVPLQVALIPLLKLYGGFDFDVSFLAPVYQFFINLNPNVDVSIETVRTGLTIDLNGKFLGLWLAHTGFGLPLAIYLLRNYIGSLPSELIESARIDGADHFATFTRLILPLSVPALASFAIFQFLWVFNDYLVALVFLSTNPGNDVLTIALNKLNGSNGESWYLLTAGAFISMIVPMIVFFSLQRFFVRGMTAGAVKG